MQGFPGSSIKHIGNYRNIANLIIIFFFIKKLNTFSNMSCFISPFFLGPITGFTTTWSYFFNKYWIILSWPKWGIFLVWKAQILLNFFFNFSIFNLEFLLKNFILSQNHYWIRKLFRIYLICFNWAEFHIYLFFLMAWIFIVIYVSTFLRLPERVVFPIISTLIYGTILFEFRNVIFKRLEGINLILKLFKPVVILLIFVGMI